MSAFSDEYYGEYEDSEEEEEFEYLGYVDMYDADLFYNFDDDYDEVNNFLASLPGVYPEDFFFTPRSRTPCASCKSVRDILKEYDNDFHAERLTEDNICKFDVYQISQHLVNVLKVIDEEANKNLIFLDEATPTPAEMFIARQYLMEVSETSKKIMKKIKYCLLEELMKLLNLPQVVVNQIFDILVDDAIAAKETGIVNFEENTEEFRKVLLSVYRYFLVAVDLIPVFLSNDPNDEFNLKKHVPGDKCLRFVVRMADGFVDLLSLKLSTSWKIFFDVNDDDDENEDTEEKEGFDIWSDDEIHDNIKMNFSFLTQVPAGQDKATHKRTNREWRAIHASIPD